MGGGAWLLMGLFWVALIVVIVWLVVRLLPDRAGTIAPPPPTPPPAQESPLDILDRRLARGEVDVETYRTGAARAGGTARG